MKGWGPRVIAGGPDGTMEMVDKFLTRMYRTNPDFVFTVTRDFVRNCRTPVLILPDDIPAHPYAVAMEAAMLAPKAEVSMFPWKEPKERIPLAIRQIRSFLRAHLPAAQAALFFEPALTLKEPVFRPRQAEIFPQRLPFILLAENPALPQFRHDLVDEVVEP